MLIGDWYDHDIPVTVRARTVIRQCTGVTSRRISIGRHIGHLRLPLLKCSARPARLPFGQGEDAAQAAAAASTLGLRCVSDGLLHTNSLP